MGKGKVQTEEIEENRSKKQNIYPSAVLLVEACYQDYQRIQDNYNKLYEKINVALAFAGVILTIVLGTLDFSHAAVKISGQPLWKIVLMILELLCTVGSVLLIMVSVLWLLMLLKGRMVKIFKSEDIRNNKIYKEEEENAAVWLIDKYTQVTFAMRTIVKKKQKSFDQALQIIIIGIIMYAVSIVLQKGGI